MDNHIVPWPTVFFSDEIINRFWSHVNKTDGCWLSVSAVNRKGYGVFGSRHSLYGQWIASRFAWFVTFGVIPIGLNVLHDCPDGDNPACVNPSHLWLGTLLENVQDCIAKGRNAKGPTHGTAVHPGYMPKGDDHWTHRSPVLVKRGDHHPLATLTINDVLLIRWLYEQDQLPQSVLAARFGVSRGHISQIVTGRRWATV